MPLPDTVSSYLSGWMMTMSVNENVVAIEESSPFGGLLLTLGPLLAAQWAIDQYERTLPR
jgi:hypothetical protein